MIKFRNIGGYKNAQNIPYIPTTVELHNGMVVTVDMTKKTLALPSADTAKGEVYLVMNRYDKPEVNSPNEYVIEVGEFPRLFMVSSLNGVVLDCDTDQITGAHSSINVGDKLTAGTDGKLAVNSSTDDFLTYFLVIEKNTFGGEGLGLQVVVQTPKAAGVGG